MTYVDGFVIAVPTAKKDSFIAHAKMFDSILMEHGALRVVECWGESVPAGKQTDFLRAVEAREDETVVFSWVEWPDKATRDAGHSQMEEMMKSGTFSPEMMEMPFDGKRMVFGGFEPVLDLGGR